MKVFIVFLGLLMVNLNFFAYTSDLNRFEKLEQRLKAAAEDCASGAALYYDHDLYGEGLYHIDQRKAQDYIAAQLEAAEKELNKYLICTLSAQAEFQDRSVVVAVNYQGEDLFRQPFLKKTEVTRIAEYKWEE